MSARTMNAKQTVAAAAMSSAHCAPSSRSDPHVCVEVDQWDPALALLTAALCH
jgi:hypothetical protein